MSKRPGPSLHPEEEAILSQVYSFVRYYLSVLHILYLVKLNLRPEIIITLLFAFGLNIPDFENRHPIQKFRKRVKDITQKAIYHRFNMNNNLTYEQQIGLIKANRGLIQDQKGMINAQKELSDSMNVRSGHFKEAWVQSFGSPIPQNFLPQPPPPPSPFENIEPPPVYTPQKLANDAAYDSKMPASASKIPGAPLSEQPFQFGNVHAPAPAAGTLPNFETVPRTASGLPAGGGLFGGPSAPAPAPGTLPNFGNVPRTASGLPAGGAAAPTPAGGLFGGPPAPAAAPTPAGGGLFGGPPAPAVAPTPAGGFRFPPAPAPAAAPTPAGGGLSGGAPAPAPTAAPTPAVGFRFPPAPAAAPTPAGGGLSGGAPAPAPAAAPTPAVGFRFPPAPAPAAAPTPAGGGLSGGAPAPAPAPATQSLGDMFKADESEWKCNECYVRTKKGVNNCKSCGAVRPGFETTDAAGGSSVSTADAQQASEQKENKNKRRRTQAGTGSKRFRRE